MPYDTGAESANDSRSNRRGLLRPSRPASARTRLTGEMLTRLMQGGDLVLLAGLSLFGFRDGGVSDLLVIAASVLVGVLLVGLEAFPLHPRARRKQHSSQ